MPDHDPFSPSDAAPGTQIASWQALAHFYQAFFTGLILHTTLKRGPEIAGQWSFKFFRRQHHQKFLSSFQKLGAEGLPDAVAAARYHYLSNRVGGVEVEYMYESDKKAWIRFPHPRWIYDGTAICGVPQEVGLGFINGWYGHNGVSLKNPRLGFVCTSQDATAEIGFTGYFLEHDHDLDESERVRFASDEPPPPFDPVKAPTLDPALWPQDRLEKARRNYAMDYVKWGLVELVDLVGAEDAQALAVRAAGLTGRQFYRNLQQRFGFKRGDDDASAFTTFMTAIAAAHDDGIQCDITVIRQDTWRLVRGMEDLKAETLGVMFDSWTALWQGCLSVHNRNLSLSVMASPDDNDPGFSWRVEQLDGRS